MKKIAHVRIVLFRQLPALRVKQCDDGIQRKAKTPGLNLHDEPLPFLYGKPEIVGLSFLLDTPVQGDGHLDSARLIECIVRFR